MVFLLLEFFTRNVPCFALEYSGAFKDLTTPFELGLLTYLTLKLMWLKFTVLWRLARLWALADDVEVVENMVRCMSNNYSLTGFWRGWHKSFNQWLVRYIYIPLGGKEKKHMNVWAVFGFVAVWHDIEAKLLAWGALNAVFMSVEQLVSVLLLVYHVHIGVYWNRGRGVR